MNFLIKIKYLIDIIGMNYLNTNNTAEPFPVRNGDRIDALFREPEFKLGYSNIVQFKTKEVADLILRIRRYNIRYRCEDIDRMILVFKKKICVLI